MLKNKLNLEIEEHLLKQAEQGHISHAYILNGEKAGASLEIAEALAEKLTESKADILYFIHEKPNLISVDEIREQINQSVYIKPYGSAYKVYIVRDAQKMNVQAQNALLKTLEEPPAYVVILLITENSNSFLQTILSRCVKINIFPEEPSENEELNPVKENLKEFMKRVPDCDEEVLLNLEENLEKQKENISEILEMFRLYFRDALYFKTTQSVKNLYYSKESPIVKGLAESLSYAGMNRILEKITETQNRIDANVNFELSMELLLEAVYQEVRNNQ